MLTTSVAYLGNNLQKTTMFQTDTYNNQQVIISQQD